MYGTGWQVRELHLGLAVKSSHLKACPIQMQAQHTCLSPTLSCIIRHPVPFSQQVHIPCPGRQPHARVDPASPCGCSSIPLDCSVVLDMEKLKYIVQLDENAQVLILEHPAFVSFYSMGGSPYWLQSLMCGWFPQPDHGQLRHAQRSNERSGARLLLLHSFSTLALHRDASPLPTGC